MLRDSDGDGSTDKKSAVARVRSAKMRSGNPKSADDRMPRAGCSNGLDGLKISGVQGTLLRVCRLWGSLLAMDCRRRHYGGAAYGISGGRLVSKAEGWVFGDGMGWGEYLSLEGQGIVLRA